MSNLTHSSYYREWKASGTIYFCCLFSGGVEKNRKAKVLVAQSCQTLCYPVDCSLPGSSVRGILQARILEWVAIPFSRASPRPRD